jgi:hypothetical protein
LHAAILEQEDDIRWRVRSTIKDRCRIGLQRQIICLGRIELIRRLETELEQLLNTDQLEDGSVVAVDDHGLHAKDGLYFSTGLSVGSARVTIRLAPVVSNGVSKHLVFELDAETWSSVLSQVPSLTEK